MRFIKGLQADSTSPFLNLPVIPTFRDIANLIECVAMFDFIKRLSVFRMVSHAPTAFCCSVVSRYLRITFLMSASSEIRLPLLDSLLSIVVRGRFYATFVR